ncbi:hypothetical protein EYF80_054008 [Liparis tanakae]|uniref:Uncharacterized protein n=1 Tax=Liparis tanakae TaxID=230148 RepID=A0A4Z2F3Y5_9TELE|nr:hypothetical protein EYF80_054008 [Liparis tanakae]
MKSIREETLYKGEVGVSYRQTAAGRLRHCCCAYFCHVRSNTCHKEIIEIDQHFIAIPNRDRKIAQPYLEVSVPSGHDIINARAVVRGQRAP